MVVWLKQLKVSLSLLNCFSFTVQLQIQTNLLYTILHLQNTSPSLTILKTKENVNILIQNPPPSPYTIKISNKNLRFSIFFVKNKIIFEKIKKKTRFIFFSPLLDFPTTYTCIIRRVKSTFKFPEFWFAKKPKIDKKSVLQNMNKRVIKWNINTNILIK